MRKIILFILIIHSTLFAQTVVSEFPIDIKHKVSHKKSTGEKWLPTPTKEYLNQFDSKIYPLSQNKQILLITSLNKLFFYLLDNEFKIIESGIIKKAPKKQLPTHVSNLEENLSCFFKVKSKSTGNLNSIINLTYNFSSQKSKLEKIKIKQKKKKILNVFFFQNELFLLSRTRSEHHLTIDKLVNKEFLNIKTYDVNGIVGYELFPLIKSVNIFKPNYLPEDYPTIQVDNNFNFRKTAQKTKIYTTKDICSLTFDTKFGTELFTINLNDSFQLSHQHFSYIKTDNKPKYNSLLADEKLFQISLHKSGIIFTTNDLKSKQKTTLSFKQGNPLFRDDNTHYGTANFFTSKQEERNKKSIENFLKYTSKGNVAISSVLKNNKHHILIGSHRIIVQQSPGMGGAIGGGVTVSLSNTAQNKFDNYTYLTVNNDNSIDLKNDLKSSIIYDLSNKTGNKKHLVFNTLYKYKNHCYACFYNALEKKYKIVRIEN